MAIQSGGSPNTIATGTADADATQGDTDHKFASYPKNDVDIMTAKFQIKLEEVVEDFFTTIGFSFEPAGNHQALMDDINILCQDEIRYIRDFIENNLLEKLKA
ncbi:hypothetical protein H4219_005425, partial [Mycoemilia scoparia]